MLEAIQKYLSYMEHEEGSAKNTILAYKNDLMQFQRYIHEAGGHTVRPENFSEDAVGIYVARVSEKGYRSSTIYRKLAAVRSFLDFLREQGLLVMSSMSEQLRISPTQRKVPHVLSKAEITKLLQGPAKLDSPLALRDRAILELIYGTGYRVGDIISLKLEDISFDQNLIQSATRITHMGESLEAIKEYVNNGRPHLARDHEESAIFLNQRGKGLTRQGLWLIVKRWSKEAELGEDVSPHTLRHSLVAHLLEEGRTVKEVQMKLGLKSPNSIRIFTALHGKVGSN